MVHRPACTLLLILGGLLAGCRQDMHDGPLYEPQERSAFFADGRASRPQLVGTVARGELREDDHLYRGRLDGGLADRLPMELTPALVDRGRERYGVFCAVCHDAAGYGNGMAVQRGMTRPTSLHTDRLRAAPVGYFFDVVTNGYGRMFDYSDRIPAEDRWAIAAWIRVLQLSQNGALADVPDAERRELEGRP